MTYANGMANDIARKLRSRMTRQEVKLWVNLRELRKLGIHFRRQVPIKGVIVDFACYHPRVIVEIDGSQHARMQQERSDIRRDTTLRAEGFRIVRVWNSDVDGNLEGVLEQILRELERD
jgi:very-short-patch-repair endonuclease